MSDPHDVIGIFNRVEALVWFGTAFALPFIVRSESRTQRWSVLAGSMGFMAFGITDFLEAGTGGKIPAWLWASKIACAAFLLACRFNFVGWRNFRFTDSWFLFGVFCLAASVVLILLG